MAIDKEKIEEAKARLGENAAHIIAKEVPIEDWNEVELKGLSIFREEKTPSMIWFKNGNCFKDFSSGETYDIINHFMAKKNISFSMAVRELFDLVGMEYSDDDFFDKAGVRNKYKNYRFPKDEEPNDRLNVEAYMMKRCISPKTLDYCHVKESNKGYIAYQIFDIDGTHVGTKYRVSKDATNKDKFKWFWQQNADTSDVLFGVDKIDTTKPTLIVEGYNDCLACIESGYMNTVSIPGGANDFKWLEENYETLEKIPEFILWYDDDEAGQKASKVVADRLGNYKVKIVDIPLECKSKISEYFGGKTDKADANNVLMSCGKDYVLKIIHDAKDVPNPRLKKLFDYEPVDIAQLPHVSTGLTTLDKLVTGNFSGDFVVLTGKSGEGKTTLTLEMCIIAPIENGHKVMAFSGEASGPVLLGRLMRPLAGPRHIKIIDNSSNGFPDTYIVHQNAQKAIAEYYKDKIWLYDDKGEMQTSAKTILDEMVYAYKKYGVDVFLLDNLMTIATSSSSDDKYSSQIEFVLALKKFTREYNVTVFLVAHSKKPQQGKEDDMYSVAGAAEIVNLADRGYSIKRLNNDVEGYDSCITVIKDRHDGRVGQKAKLFYHRPSNRIFSDLDELKRSYKWEACYKSNYDKDFMDNLAINKIREPKKVDTSDIFGIPVGNVVQKR